GRWPAPERVIIAGRGPTRSEIQVGVVVLPGGASREKDVVRRQQRRRGQQSHHGERESFVKREQFHGHLTAPGHEHETEGHVRMHHGGYHLLIANRSYSSKKRTAMPAGVRLVFC